MAAESLRLLVPRQLRALPADLAAVVVLVLLTDLSVLLPVVKETPLRIVFGLAFVLFLPGYAFIAALFPEDGAGPPADEADAAAEAADANADVDGPEAGADADGSGGSRFARDGGIDGIERVALSFGLSIALVPLVGLVLNFTPWGIRLVPILLSLTALTLACTAVAAVRRWEVPADERFAVPYREWLAAGRAELLEPDTQLDGALNLLLVVSVLLAVGSVGYAVAVPQQGETFTEFYLLTENETGDLVAADYPTEYTVGASQPVVVGIGNQEHEQVDYTVVVELQDVTIQNNSTTVTREAELRRFTTRVAHNETWRTTYNVTPTFAGEELRLTFLLYRGDPPADPTVDTAYRELHLWVNVSRAG